MARLKFFYRRDHICDHVGESNNINFTVNSKEVLKEAKKKRDFFVLFIRNRVFFQRAKKMTQKWSEKNYEKKNKIKIIK